MMQFKKKVINMVNFKKETKYPFFNFKNTQIYYILNRNMILIPKYLIK